MMQCQVSSLSMALAIVAVCRVQCVWMAHHQPTTSDLVMATEQTSGLSTSREGGGAAMRATVMNVARPHWDRQRIGLHPRH